MFSCTQNSKLNLFNSISKVAKIRVLQPSFDLIEEFALSLKLVGAYA
jgi:hypothetical protein